MSLDDKVLELAQESLPKAVELLREAIRIPADYVDRPTDDGGDPDCGLSNHEGPRLEYLRGQLVQLGAVDQPDDASYDAFGNLHWTLQDPEDGIPTEEKTVVYFDGHTDTVKALRHRWREAAGAVDAYDGLLETEGLEREFLREELGYLPPDDEWQHLLWGRGSADQLGGVVCQIMASRILRRLRSEGALEGIIVRSFATVTEEDNDGGGPMFFMRDQLAGAGPEKIPDALILTEGTGSSADGALGLYRGQRGRMQIEVVVTGKSCHGSMPWEGRNPLEFGGAILAEAAAQYQSGETFADDDFLGAGSRTASWAKLETPSDCAVPERFIFRLDRRLTAGEDPQRAIADVDRLPTIARARSEGLQVKVHCPTYDVPTWKQYQPGNQQIYPGWVTPEEHPAIAAAVDTYRRTVSPLAPANGTHGALRQEPRVSRWVFSTDGVGVPLRTDDEAYQIPESKRWVSSGPFRHPAMFGIGPGIEHNTHKIGECVDCREIAPVIAFYARFPSVYRTHR